MLVLKDIDLHFGDRTLFDRLSWSIKPGEKIVLIGRNGVGKSTLFKVITGQLTPDHGSIDYPRESKVGLLVQDLDKYDGHTIKSLALTAFPEIEKHSKSWQHLEVKMANCSDDDEMMNLSEKMSDLAEEMSHLGAHQKIAEAEKVLKGLGFKDDDMNRPIEEFSGGWQMRVLLARLLLIQPEYLLLDEPTNHLDIVSVIWLENYLREYPGAYVVISHDKRFLNKVADKVVEIDMGKIRSYSGNYDAYLIQREEQKEILLNTYKNQQSEIERKQRLIDKYRAKASKASTAKALASELNRMEKVEIEPEDNRHLNIRFPDAPRSAERVFETEKLSKSYGDLKVFEDIDFMLLRGQKISLIGQNGQGKSTMAKILTGHVPSSSGAYKIGPNVIMKYFAQDQGEQIDGNYTVLDWLEEQASPEMRPRVRSILGAFLFSQEDVDKKVKVLSGGERSRLAMAALVLQPMNFLIMDEPTNHLDMQSKEILKAALQNYNGALLVISHDRDFLEGISDVTAIIHNRNLTMHLGDVDSFLEQKGFENLVDFSLSGETVKETNTEKKVDQNQVDHERQKLLERRLKRIEKDIELIETQQAAHESKMAQEGFFDRDDSHVLTNQYEKNKEKLETLSEEWDEVVTMMES